MLKVMLGDILQNVAYDSLVTKPADPEQSGFSFGGWYLDEDCTQAWNFEADTVTEDITLYPKWIEDTVPTAKVSGIVTEDGSAVSGAKVELCLGITLVAATSTGADGSYCFDNVENGVYNIVVTSGSVFNEKVLTELVDIDASGSFTADIEFPAKDVSTKVDVSPIPVEDSRISAVDTVVGGLNAIARNITVSDTDKVTIKLTVQPKDESEVENAEAIKAEAGSDKKFEFLDLSLLEMVNDEPEQDIGGDNTQLLTIVIPFDFTDIDVSSVTIIRKHGTENAEKLTKNPARGQEGFTLDRQAGTITLYAMKFSDYAIAYNEETYSPGGGGSSYGVTGDITYAINCIEPENGSLTVSSKTASAGQDVTITVTPDEGYQLNTLNVTDAKGNVLILDEESDTTRTFTMPSSKVTVSADFVKIETCPQDEIATMSMFNDLDIDAWYHDGVSYCLANGIMSGKGNAKFDPDGITTRAQIAQILYNLDGRPAFMNDNIFSDVASGSWYEKAVVWAQGKGVSSGYPDGTFKPEASITREQLAVILYNYARYKGIDVSVDENTNFLSFNDFWDVSEWAKPAMMWAVERELIVGSNGNLKPQGDATRAQAATIIWKFCETVVK